VVTTVDEAVEAEAVVVAVVAAIMQQMSMIAINNIHAKP